jgi:hypothetical protein
MPKPGSGGPALALAGRTLSSGVSRCNTHNRQRRFDFGPVRIRSLMRIPRDAGGEFAQRGGGAALFGSFHRLSALARTSGQTIGGRPRKVRLKSHSLPSFSDVSPRPPLYAGATFLQKKTPPSPAEFSLCAEHDRQLGGGSPLPSLMTAKG